MRTDSASNVEEKLPTYRCKLVILLTETFTFRKCQIDQIFFIHQCVLFHDSKVHCSQLLVQYLTLHFESCKYFISCKCFIYAILSQGDDGKKSNNSFLSQWVFVVSETAVISVLVRAVGALKLWRLFIRNLGYMFLKSVIEISKRLFGQIGNLVGHDRWPTKFLVWLNNLLLKFVEITDYWRDYLDPEMWQTACIWHGRENEKKIVCSLNIISASSKILWSKS